METIIEIQTPLPLHVDTFLSLFSQFNFVNSIILCEQDGVSGAVIAERLRKKYKQQLFLKILCSNKNRIALYSELATAASLGFSSLVLADGAHPLTTSFPSAKPVYDLDALHLLRALKGESSTAFTGVPPLREMAEWKIGVCIGGSTKPDLIKAERFLSLGADFIFTHSLETVQHLKRLTNNPIFLSVPQDEANDFSSALEQAKKSGADGVNIIFRDIR